MVFYFICKKCLILKCRINEIVICLYFIVYIIKYYVMLFYVVELYFFIVEKFY